MFTFKPLWKTLIDKELNKTELQKRIACSSSTIHNMTKNQNVSMDILDRICNVLECNINDIIEHIKEDKEQK